MGELIHCKNCNGIILLAGDINIASIRTRRYTLSVIETINSTNSILSNNGGGMLGMKFAVAMNITSERSNGMPR